jgi:hypothetical protein
MGRVAVIDAGLEKLSQVEVDLEKTIIRSGSIR